MKLNMLVSASAAGDPEQSTIKDVSKCFAVDVPSSVSKFTTVNPKYTILQDGFVNDRSHVQCMEPIMLSSWQSNLAAPPGTYKLDFTISPNYLANLVNDISGQYGCPTTNGKMIRMGASLPATILPHQVYCRIKDIALHVHYVHPAGGSYVPRSVSQKFMPFQVIKRQLRNKVVQESFTVSPSTKAVLVFLTQEQSHLCIDNELDSRARAGGGCNSLGVTSTAEGSNTYGIFQYDSRPRAAHKTPYDPRLQNTDVASHSEATFDNQETGAQDALEISAPMFWQSLQAQLGSDVQPAQMLTEQDPTKGLVSRAWSLYVNFIAKSAGYRSSLMSYSEFCGIHNSNFGSAPRCGTRGVWHAFNIQTQPGSLASDLQIRGSLSDNPNEKARQFITIMALSENMFDIEYQNGSPLPVVTRVTPLS